MSASRSPPQGSFASGWTGQDPFSTHPPPSTKAGRFVANEIDVRPAVAAMGIVEWLGRSYVGGDIHSGEDFAQRDAPDDAALAMLARGPGAAIEIGASGGAESP